MLPVHEIESIRAIVREELSLRTVRTDKDVPAYAGEMVLDEKKAVWIAIDAKQWRKLSN